eukprot:8706749-Pyramimonas_sp.AAC.1
MVRDMSIPLMHAGLAWKPKSLMYIYFGAPPGIPPSPGQDIRVLVPSCDPALGAREVVLPR